MLVFSTVLIILLWLFQIVFLDAFYKQIKINSINSSINKLAEEFNEDNFYNSAKEISLNNNFTIEVIDDSGNILSTINKHNQTIFNDTIKKNNILIFNEAIANNGSLTKFYNDNDNDIIYEKDESTSRKVFSLPPGRENIFAARIVEDEEERQYLLIVRGLIAPVSNTVSTLRVQLYIITFLMIIFSLLLAAIIAKKISKPIVSISNSAKELSKGNYNLNCCENGFKEIEELSESMNNASIELSKVETLRKEFIANISHDLKTPLTLIKGYAEAMRDLPGENTPENIQIIIDESQRLNSLVSDILDLSKIQSGSDFINAEKFNITESFKNIASSVQTFVKNKGYNIVFYSDKDYVIEGDKLKLEQAFYNLLINGVNHTGDDKKVFIQQLSENDWLTIKVSDTGDGINSKDLPYIWDRYYKGKTSHKRGIIGTGIGLSIVKTIVTQHKGIYGANNNKEDIGSTFWFKLKL